MKVARATERKSSDNTAFESRYTKDQSGFYVRNTKPSSGVLNPKRISDNLRSLLDDTNTDDQSED